eukprot:Gb_20500 [translate_table: standard]
MMEGNRNACTDSGAASKLETLSFADFRPGKSFELIKDASISNGAMQLTPDSRNDGFQLKNKSGRVILDKRFRLWTKSSPRNHVASFTTSFLLNIFALDKGNGGDGLAFIIAPNKEIPDNSHGQWLGLFNSSTDGNPSNKLVAVEFDTRKTGNYDPDSNHVGIDVNSIRSEIARPLGPANVFLKSSANFTAWVQYDGLNSLMKVYVAKEFDPMPPIPILNYSIDLSDFLDEEVYFGFSGSTGNTTELNCILKWNITIEQPESKDAKKLMIVILCVCIPAAVIALIAGIIIFQKHRQTESDPAISDALQNLPGRPREFRFKHLKKATTNFHPNSVLGSGGFGTVYRGILRPKAAAGKSNIPVAVKRISKDSKQGKKEFIAEITIINRLQHRNLVPLLGWCHDKGDLLLVYEYMPNGSLDKHIFEGENPQKLLNWDQRFNIVAGVASALLYLHEECQEQVIHRDLKASNIMLDSDCNARLGDFGLARIIEHDRRSYTGTGVAGTFGYIAPECFHTGKATAESDVYSFGAVALEVACGRPPKLDGEADLVDWVWKLYREQRLIDAADTRLAMGSESYDEDDISCLLLVGLACSSSNPGARPTMRQVIQILAKTMPPPFVPPFRPAFVWLNTPSDSFTTSHTANSGVDSLNTLLQFSSGNAGRSAVYRRTLSSIDI